MTAKERIEQSLARTKQARALIALEKYLDQLDQDRQERDRRDYDLEGWLDASR